MKNIIIAAVVIALLAFGGFTLANRNSADNDNATVNDGITATPTLADNTNNEAQDESTVSPSPAGGDDAQSGTSGDAQAVTVMYGTGGFDKATVTVKSGSTVTVTNNSGSNAQPSSDPHPEHTGNTQLNFGELAAGESKTVTVTKVGTWGIHDHLDTDNKMTIIVQ